MKTATLFAATCLATLFVAGAAEAQPVPRGDRPVLQVLSALAPGEYVWAPELSPEGPALLVVNLATQRAVLFRNGVPIAATTVSTGKEGHETPTGVFTILQKRREHYSNLYNNAPMPNMQRLTWDGIALHAGKLPGYPASHGCVRLPMEFSRRLFEVTELGMTVVITSIPAAPQNAAAPEVAVSATVTGQRALETAPFEWHPERAGDGIVSVIVSAADQRAVVLRDGVEIGSAPVRVDGPVGGGMAYVLRASDETGRHWLRLSFAGLGAGMEVPAGEGQRFDAPSGFRSLLSDVLKPGSAVIVTPESLGAGSPGLPLTVIGNEDS
ncbi:MAG TPA: L,D-transpeptidase family protein [Croceibacterium sp.]